MIINEQITNTYKDILLEEVFDFNKPSPFRISFVNPIKSNLYILNPVIE